MKFDARVFFENLSKKFVLLMWERIAGALHDDRYTLLITYRSVLLRMRNL